MEILGVSLGMEDGSVEILGFSEGDVEILGDSLGYSVVSDGAKDTLG